MKLSQKFFAAFLIFLLTGPLRAGLGYACDARCQADKHFETAEKAAQTHQPVEAIREYVQVLLFDPSHPAAKSSLRKIASSYDEEFLKYRMRVYRIQELLDYIFFIKQQISSSPEGPAAVQETFDLDAGQERNALDGIIEYLARTKRKLVDQYWELQGRSAGLAQRPKTVSLTRAADVQPKENLGVLQFQMDRLRQEVNNLKEIVSSSEKRIAALASQLTQKSLDIYEKDALLAQQQDGYVSLQDSLQEAQERLSLVQRIMEEKDAKIQAMARDVKTLQAFAEQYHATSDESVQALRREFIGLQKELIGQISISREKIEVMEGVVARQGKQMTVLNIAGRAKGKRIGQMNQALAQKNQKIKQREQIIGWQGERLVESGGILEIYKDKLHETSRMLKEKIKRIRELEKQSAEKAY